MKHVIPPAELEAAARIMAACAHLPIRRLGPVIAAPKRISPQKRLAEKRKAEAIACINDALCSKWQSAAKLAAKIGRSDDYVLKWIPCVAGVAMRGDGRKNTPREYRK